MRMTDVSMMGSARQEMVTCMQSADTELDCKKDDQVW